MSAFKNVLVISVCLQLIFHCAMSKDVCPDGLPAIKPCKTDTDCRKDNLLCADTGDNDQYCCATKGTPGGGTKPVPPGGGTKPVPPAQQQGGCKDQLPDECKNKQRLCTIKEYKRLMIKFCNSVCFQCKTPP